MTGIQAVENRLQRARNRDDKAGYRLICKILWFQGLAVHGKFVFSLINLCWFQKKTFAHRKCLRFWKVTKKFGNFLGKQNLYLAINFERKMQTEKFNVSKL